MRYGAFVPYSILCTGLWASAHILIGYFFSRSIDTAAEYAGRGAFLLGALIVVTVGSVLLYRRLRVAENRRAAVLGDPQAPVEQDRADGDDDQRAEQEGAAAGVLGGGVDAAREEVADQDVGAGPEPGAEDAVGDEGAVAHLRAAGDERRQGADDADPAADEDRLAAVPGEVVLDPLEALAADPEAGPVAEHEAAAEAAADEEAGRVAHPGGEPGDRDQDVDVDRALAGDGAAEQHRRLAGHDQADEGAGLGEGEDADQQVGPGAERVGDVLEQLLQFVVRDDPADQVVAG